MSRTVPFFDYPSVYTQDEEAYQRILSDVGRRGAFIMQSDLREFEEQLAEYTGAKYAVGVANATDGLQMGMMAGGLEAGFEAIFCSHTMVATASAIHFAGGVPVPVDAGADHLIDVAAIEAAITDKTRAIVPTQLNGRVADMDVIIDIADRHGLEIYEDAAQALGARYKGKMGGTFGIASCISFYPAKVLGCFGDGGAVLTNDVNVYEKLMLLRDHGRSDSTGEIEIWGFNSRMDNLQAAILSHNLKEYQQVIDRRRHIASKYDSAFSEISQLQLPPAPVDDGDHFDIFQNYEIEAQDRDALQAHLREHGIGTLVQWGGSPVHLFRALGFDQSLPATEALFDRLLMLPMNMALSDDDVAYVCDTVASFYEGKNSA